MRETETIFVERDLDIISARARVRNLARVLGFNTADQARISLATSSLAYFLDMGGKYDGQISFGPPHNGENVGIEVNCTVHCGAFKWKLTEANLKKLDKIRWMVDELKIETLVSDDVRVILIKWIVQGN